MVYTRTSLKFLLCTLIFTAFGSQAETIDSRIPTHFENMVQKAKSLAEHSFKSTQLDFPPSLANMNYDQYRRINFRSESALWRNRTPFEVQFFHPGFLYKEPVEIQTISLKNELAPVPFDTTFFHYHRDPIVLSKEEEEALTYSGFRIHYPLNSAQYKDEFLVFLGASYFRLVGPGHIYGLSARGIAINTAEKSGEEFPSFKEFWLFEPDKDQHQLFIIALLDSPSLSGAYLFEITPGLPTNMVITARLFPRKDITKLGVAPLTSMFFFGENKTRFYDDFRPEVHDSDGLLMQTHSNEWIWRPLSNPVELRVTSLHDTNPLGFGLLQRDRNFFHYQDVEARYEKRPSLWVSPEGNWGEGHLELVEIPSDSETNDNIVSYWVPHYPIKGGSDLHFRYRLSTFSHNVSHQTDAQVVNTRIGWAALPGQENPPPKTHRQFIVDFKGNALNDVSSEAHIVPKLDINKGQFKDLSITQLSDQKTWRVSFKLIPKDNDPVDLRLFLTMGERRLSEVWSYVWSANEVH